MSPSSSRFDRSDGRFQVHDADQEGLSDLLRRFAQDAAGLVRQEIALAKLELREAARAYIRDSAMLGIAAAAALLGTMVFLAFVVIGFGQLIGNYWLSALLVSLMLFAAAGGLAAVAIAHLRRNSVAPEATVESLKNDRKWAQSEARDLKRKLRA